MKYAGDRGDPYLDKDTGVLRNLLNITTQEELDTAESSLSFLRTNELREKPVAGNFGWLKFRKAVPTLLAIW